MMEEPDMNYRYFTLLCSSRCLGIPGLLFAGFVCFFREAARIWLHASGGRPARRRNGIGNGLRFYCVRTARGEEMYVMIVDDDSRSIGMYLGGGSRESKFEFVLDGSYPTA